MTTPELLAHIRATEQRLAKANNQLLIKRMGELRTNAYGDAAWMLEDRADRELISHTQKVMQQSLSQGRSKGKSGWWNQDKCDATVLRNLMYRAIDENDLVSVINYAAMLHVRKITDAQ